jgi:thioredoxin 2
MDESPQLQRRFGVQAIPTLPVLRQGQEIARQIGAPAPKLRDWLTGALSG